MKEANARHIANRRKSSDKKERSKMNWEPQKETLNILQSYFSSALVAMLNIHLISIFLKWLQKRKDWTNEREDQSNNEFIPDY
jgi:hypothetical protein